MAGTTYPTFPSKTRKPALQNSPLSVLARNWLMVFGVVYGAFVILPFLAPVFMHLGWTPPGRLIYLIYSFVCHQLPERSFFLFGNKFTYSLAEIQSAWQMTTDPMILRKFIGNPEMGWKVAWSDRMFSMYTSVWIFGLLWGVFRRRIGRLPLWVFALLALPMAIDGTSHLISDLYGIGRGFRDTNTWLALLTNNVFPATFYAGDAWGSFNSLMRLLSGGLFGLGVVWLSFPVIEAAIKQPDWRAENASRSR